MRRILKLACVSVTLILGLGLTGADAFVGKPGHIETPLETAIRPAAMCGFRCEFGGRYIPGPPEVCSARGMRFCGPSRRSYEPPPSFYGGYGGGYREYGGGCRTVTIERDDGTVRRIRRCD